MLSPLQLRRFWQIRRVYRRYGLAEALGKPVKRSFAEPIGVRLRKALEELGPVFVKFGQALSTRPDILPPELAGELSKLQDQVPSFPGAEARALVEQALGKSVGQVFAIFDDKPLASASIAQVHAARLKGENGAAGFDVVVKVVRPGIHAQIRRVVDLLHALAQLAEWFSPLAPRLRPKEVVAEYEKVIFDELDLLREAANASQLRRNWLGSEMIYHPLVVWELCRPNVMVMERLHGVPVDEIATLRQRDVDIQLLAERGVEIFFREVFFFNFFHADMHPGNVFVDTSDPANPRWLALDFGIVGSLTPDDQRYLAENFVAFFDQDYRRVAELHVESGWVPATTRVDEFEGAIRSVCEPIFNRPLSELSFGMFLLRLFEVARRFDMTVQPQLVLLQKTILQVEGLGRQLYPDLDLWKTAKPLMTEWMQERMSPKRVVAQLRRQGPQLLEALPRALSRLGNGHSGGVGQADLDRMLDAFRSEQRSNRRTMIGATLMLSALVIFGLDGYRPAIWNGMPVISWLLGASGLVLWLSARRPDGG